jgi:hypothetical protein
MACRAKDELAAIAGEQVRAEFFFELPDAGRDV